jgi:ankyrin repeat protein
MENPKNRQTFTDPDGWLHGWTLHEAARNGDVDRAMLLTAEGADVNRMNALGLTALYIASWKGHINMVRFLVNEGASVDLGDEDGWSLFTSTPLFVASRHGHLDVVRFLVNEGADVNRVHAVGLTALYTASRHGHLDVVRFLVNEGGASVDLVNDGGLTALDIAIQQNNIDVVVFLFSRPGLHQV